MKNQGVRREAAAYFGVTSFRDQWHMESKLPLDNKESSDNQVCENVARLLEVSAAQIEMAMRDGSKAFDNLAAVSTDIFNLISELENVLGQDHEKLVPIFHELHRKRNDALEAFQFFDLLNQRVDHGVSSVSQLSQYLKNKNIDLSDDCWEDFKEGITTQFSLDQEKRLFELMMAGATRADALRQIEEMYANDNRVSVEFF